MEEILNISVSYRLKQGEKRNNPRLSRYKAESFNYQNYNPYNPYPVIMNHRKHAAVIYREAEGGIERTFNRHHGILVE